MCAKFHDYLMIIVCEISEKQMQRKSDRFEDFYYNSTHFE